jgi:Skp family chaperone for outer membrane proteins
MFSKKNPKELQEIQNKRWNSLQPIQTKIETKSMEYKPSDIDSYNISEKKKEIKNHTFKLKKTKVFQKKKKTNIKK